VIIEREDGVSTALVIILVVVLVGLLVWFFAGRSYPARTYRILYDAAGGSINLNVGTPTSGGALLRECAMNTGEPSTPAPPGEARDTPIHNKFLLW